MGVMKAMRDASRSLMFAAQWPCVRDVAVKDMDLEPLLSNAMPPERPEVKNEPPKYPNHVDTCRHRGPNKSSSLKKYGTSVGTITLCDQCGALCVLWDGQQVLVAPKLGPQTPKPTGLHRAGKAVLDRLERVPEVSTGTPNAACSAGSSVPRAPMAPRTGARRTRPSAKNYNVPVDVKVVPMTDEEASKRSGAPRPRFASATG